jgi:hypothetical protein
MFVAEICWETLKMGLQSCNVKRSFKLPTALQPLAVEFQAFPGNVTDLMTHLKLGQPFVCPNEPCLWPKSAGNHSKWAFKAAI